MLEIINEVLEAEHEAEARLAEARESSRRLLASLEQEQRETENRVRAEMNSRVTEELTRLRTEQEVLFNRELAELQSNADRFSDEHEESLRDLTDDIVRLVLKSPLNKKK